MRCKLSAAGRQCASYVQVIYNKSLRVVPIADKNQVQGLLQQLEGQLVIQRYLVNMIADLNSHNRKCKIKPIKCKICEKDFRQKQIVQHMKEQHFQKLYEICLDFHLGSQESLLTSKISSTSSKLHNSKIKNSKGKMSQIGTTGKYYCGGNLIGKCGCCNGKCGPTNGENCDDCMAEDMKRFNLQKGYLVNPDGIPCQLDCETKVYSCGRNMRTFVCDPQKKLCQSCARVSNSVKIGRYLKLI